MSDNAEPEYGPLGLGHAPYKDPMKGLRGVIASVSVLESITVFLALTVVLKIDSGSYWTPFNWGFIVVMGTIHLILGFCQRASWALPVLLVFQVVGVVGGLFVHWSVASVFVIFILVWWYVLTLRRNMIERMRRGLLTTQHLGPSGED